MSNNKPLHLTVWAGAEKDGSGVAIAMLLSTDELPMLNAICFICYHVEECVSASSDN